MFWRGFDPKYQMMVEYVTTNTYPSASHFVELFLLARQNHAPVPICYTYTIEDRGQFNDQFREVLDDVRRVNKFTPDELTLYYLQEQDVIIGNVACEAAKEAVASANNLFLLQTPSRDEFLTKVYYHTYNQVIDERWRLSRDFIDAMVREEMMQICTLLF